MQNRRRGAYLLQIGQQAYNKLVASQLYSNSRWRERPEDQLQGLIRPGDTLVIYALGSVVNAGNQLIAVQNVRSVSPDHNQIKLEGKNLLLSPVPQAEIRRWVLEGRLDPAFQNCGTSGHNLFRVAQSSVRWLIDPEATGTQEDEERILNIYRSEMGQVRRFLFEQPRPPATLEQEADWLAFCVKFGNYVEAIMLWALMDKGRLEENQPALYRRLSNLIDMAHGKLDEA